MRRSGNSPMWSLQVWRVMRLSIDIMFSTHICSFGGRSYKQKEGGLRSTCALSRVVMARWDEKWKARMQSSNIKVEDDGRYVDDARVFMYPVRAGWRWEGGELWYRKEWEEEDYLLSPTERTKRMVYLSMQGQTECLKIHCGNIRGIYRWLATNPGLPDKSKLNESD